MACCKTIGPRRTNAELIEALTRNKVPAASRVCEQIAEMLGCYTPESRAGFIPIIRLGPKGVEIKRTNPPSPNIDCSDVRGQRRAATLCALCSSPSSS